MNITPVFFYLGFIALLADAFEEKDRFDKTGEVSRRSVLHIHPSLAPYKVAIYTNSTNENELSEVSHQLASELRQAGENGVIFHLLNIITKKQ